MRLVTQLRILPIVVGSAVLFACGHGTGPAASSESVDMLLSELNSVQAIGGMGMAIGGQLSPTAPTQSPSACLYSASSSRFVCPARTAGGLTFRSSYQLLDAAGRPQAEFSATTTAAIRTISEMLGTLGAVAGVTSGITVESRGEQVLSGLLTGTHIVNGIVNSTHTMTVAERTFTTIARSTTTDLVMPRRGSGSHWPQSGSIASEIETGDGYASRTRMTFNGTSIVTLELTTAAGTRTCTVDLQNPTSFGSCFLGSQ